MKTVRSDTHASTWYSANAPKLSRELSEWLADVATDQTVPNPRLKAIIAPHAGYAYSGPTAAWAYRFIDPSLYDKVFVLGPSHHVYLPACAVSSAEVCKTPLGDLPVDQEVVSKLLKDKAFRKMKLSVDEDEHSIEMHLPYIRHVFRDRDITIVPILVGALSSSLESDYGALLAPYLDDERTLFVVSSDFCHWGSRFDYTYYSAPPDNAGVYLAGAHDPQYKPQQRKIYESITLLDQAGMDAIAYDTRSKKPGQSFSEFKEYLGKTENTICGRHPISVLLGALTALQETWKDSSLEFVQYRQSSECVSYHDSSVSYASGIVLK